MVRILIDSETSDNRAEDKAFCKAATYGDEAIIRRLLVTGRINVNYKFNNQPPLWRAVVCGNKAVVRLLLTNPCIQVNATGGENQMTPLAVAAQWGRLAVVELLLATKGVQINLMDRDGRKPLSVAAQYGQLAVVKPILAMKGVQVLARDYSGWTPLDLVRGQHRVEAELETRSGDENGREVRMILQIYLDWYSSFQAMIVVVKQRKGIAQQERAK